MRKLLLMCVAVTLGFAARAQAYCNPLTTTCFTNVDVSGALSAGSMACTNISTSTLTSKDANITYGITAATATIPSVALSTVTISGTQGLRLGSVIVQTGTPAAAGIIARDAANLLYISTAATPAGWVKVGGQ